MQCTTKRTLKISSIQLNHNNKNKYKFPESVLAVFAKEPRTGEVKTRLQPLLGAAKALALHETLIRYVFGNLQRTSLCPAEFWVAVSPTSIDNKPHEVFLSICNIKDIHFQNGADLGARMQYAVEHALRRADSVILVGADCPSVDAAYLQQALTLLKSGKPVVIGPADDGGYVLLGLRRKPDQPTIDANVYDALFGAVPWGTERVVAVTRERLAYAGIEWAELAMRWDVDRPEDLARLKTLQPPFPTL